MKKKLAVFFGGQSLEHEVSIITGVQLMRYVDEQLYELLPIYVDKQGQWWTGEKLTDMAFFAKKDLGKLIGLEHFSSDISQLSKKIDVAILAFHGAYGEDGTIQAILDAAAIPYQSSDPTSMAITFDKIVTRQILQAEGIGQTEYFWFNRQEWQHQQAAILSKVTYPAFVKTARSGSSIGVIKVKNVSEFKKAVAALLHYGDRVLVEKAVSEDFIEVNVSVLGDTDSYQASVIEQPIKSADFLSFADKYEGDGAKKGSKKMGMASASRRIPAPLSPQLSQKIQDLAKRAASIFDCKGVIRIDFFANPSTEEVLLIEINAIPGSMSFYLWDYGGLSYPQLINRLVAIAEKKYRLVHSYVSSFASNILKGN